jgi:hypothetical protein
MSGCPIYEKEYCECIEDDTALLKYTLALIKELTEENERLKERAERHLENLKAVLGERSESNIVADTVREMQGIIKGIVEFDIALTEEETEYLCKRIDETAEEMLGEEK